MLGCSGSLPGPQSPASGYLVEADDAAGRTWRVLVDLGSGALGPLQRYADLRALDAILLSHLHPDHCMDLCGLYVALKYAPDGRARVRVPVHGPPGTAHRMARAYGLPPLPGMSEEFDFRTWEDGVPVRVGPLAVTASQVAHPGDAFGIRIEHEGRVLAYSGDTDACDALGRVAADADLFLCEAAFQEGRDETRGIHLTGLRAGQAATAAGARRLVLTHLPPWNDPQEVVAEARAAYAGPIELACAGGVLQV